ncbi:MAG: hypothetical protein HYR50_16635 [Candidatus Rokubacteria bacterium]|nr:hypothetical protein [Candidatus Rokubacteria bacterium]
MAKRSRQWRITDPTKVSTNWGARSVRWAWLELVLPFFAAALLVVFHMPQYLPRVFVESVTSPLAWVAWAVLGAVSGVMVFSGLLVAFFLLYSPIYLAGKAPMLVGRGGWIDRREIRFYGLCFVTLCVLLALLLWDWRWFVSAFLLVTGFAPTFWRALV